MSNGKKRKWIKIKFRENIKDEIFIFVASIAIAAASIIIITKIGV